MAVSLESQPPHPRSDQADRVALGAASARAHYTLLALFITMAIAFIDRQLLNLLVDPIRRDLHLSDTQFSLLQGAAFTLTYVFVMMPVAWASDQFNRKFILILSIVTWSLMTVAFGLAGGFAGLILARAGVAIGEAGATPASVSMLRDVYPRHRQTAAIAVLTIGANVGGAISLAGGGAALDALTRLQQTVTLPGDLAPWRLLFVGAGAIGVIAIVLLLAVREPAREPHAREAVSWGEYLRLLRTSRTRAVAFLAAFVGLGSISTATAAWFPSVLMRAHGLSAQTVGLSLGALHLAFGTAGALAGGWLTDRMAARGRPDGYIVILQVSALAIGLSGCLAALAPDPTLALVANAVTAIGGGVGVALGSAAFQAMFPARFSARAVATYMLVMGVLGASLGPTAVPLLASLIGNGEAVAHGLAVWTGMASIWALAWLFVLARASNGPAPAH